MRTKDCAGGDAGGYKGPLSNVGLRFAFGHASGDAVAGRKQAAPGR